MAERGGCAGAVPPQSVSDRHGLHGGVVVPGGAHRPDDERNRGQHPGHGLRRARRWGGGIRHGRASTDGQGHGARGTACGP